MCDSQLHAAKIRMLDRHLAGRGISDAAALAAVNKIPRELFLSQKYAAKAYDDCALAIDCGQTISQPYIVALMTEVLKLSGKEKVLEIGTGSGYQAAVLAELSSEVVSVERHALLSRQAGMILDRLGYKNVRLYVGDGTLGRPESAPYDRIIVTAMAERCPNALFDQLCEGGIMVIPIGDNEHQVLQAIRKINNAAVTENITGCRFVPLIGEQGWKE
jgi:protein-L-isoaspartate(D-aspartate) O-methyltransferase